jgi:hypothetical protein
VDDAILPPPPKKQSSEQHLITASNHLLDRIRKLAGVAAGPPGKAWRPSGGNIADFSWLLFQTDSTIVLTERGGPFKKTTLCTRKPGSKGGRNDANFEGGKSFAVIVAALRANKGNSRGGARTESATISKP